MKTGRRENETALDAPDIEGVLGAIIERGLKRPYSTSKYGFRAPNKRRQRQRQREPLFAVRHSPFANSSL